MTLPKLTRKLENYRGGGMNGAAAIDLGLDDDALTVEWSVVGLPAVAQSEVDALIKVLPRMTYPALTAQELTAMNLPDMLSLAAKVIGFLSPASAE
ncbi:phage major tail tube protein [Salmonella enterica]|uniref:phage major tail tube protein n=1 Tax=Salmonella enterica TaxID=28901 RepID=UPI003977B3AB